MFLCGGEGEGRLRKLTVPPPAPTTTPARPQAFHVCTSPVVQAAWAEGQELHVAGLIYDVADGRLRQVRRCLNCLGGGLQGDGE